MPVSFEVATTPNDLVQILDLQRLNHATTLSADDAARDGFVTVKHTLELLTKMNASVPQVIAKDNDTVVGYALVMLRSFESMIPVLQPMFERLSGISVGAKRVTDHTFYVMGQICVDANYRGQGVFDGLYKKHRELYSRDYQLCVTSVATRNHRSMRAHKRVGFKTVQTFRDATDEWNILVWDWTHFQIKL
jgi:ribosomal protein S18 acetylase RimI-like enzyme